MSRAERSRSPSAAARSRASGSSASRPDCRACTYAARRWRHPKRMRGRRLRRPTTPPVLIRRRVDAGRDTRFRRIDRNAVRAREIPCGRAKVTPPQCADDTLVRMSSLGAPPTADLSTRRGHANATGRRSPRTAIATRRPDRDRYAPDVRPRWAPRRAATVPATPSADRSARPQPCRRRQSD